MVHSSQLNLTKLISDIATKISDIDSRVKSTKKIK